MLFTLLAPRDWERLRRANTVMTVSESVDSTLTPLTGSIIADDSECEPLRFR